MSLGPAIVVSVLLLALNAFFVAAEFAVVAAKRHRLEERAAEGSRAASAAVRANRELSLMLAGAQLGITLCTLGLGALAEPAVAQLFTPAFEATGLSPDLSHVIAVVLAVAIVVFLHMVVGEMAPKSWAISHPETSAVALALPFRAFAWAVRPLLHVFNGTANLFLRVIGVDPVDTVSAAHGPAELQLLLAQSHEHGVLPDEEHQMLTGALRLEQEKVANVMFPVSEAVTVPEDGTADDVERLCHASGRSRLFVVDPTGRITGLVHVRDAVLATVGADRPRPLREFVLEVARIPVDLPLIDAVTRMRQERAQLALVEGPDGSVVGLTSLEDILEKILGEFDDETDEPDPS